MTRPIRLFVVACLYPGGVLDRSRVPRERGRLSDESNASGPPDRAFKRLDECRLALGGSRCDLLMAGDQIYVDATAGLFDPRQRDRPLERSYAALETQTWRQMALDPLKLDRTALMDDHEVVDNWEPSAHRGRDEELHELLRRGLSQFQLEQRDVLDKKKRDKPLWGSRALRSGHTLFFGDTRSERELRVAELLAKRRDGKKQKPWNEACIMSGDQMDALIAALAAPYPWSWRFAATPSILLPRRLTTVENTADAIRSDAWDGYPHSQFELLGRIADAGLPRCVFLSGDEHIPCIATITLKPDAASGRTPVTLWSVHTGALYAPYPFANSVAEDFPGSDSFELTSPQGIHWTCEVEATFPPYLEDGFLEIVGDDPGPLRVTFRSARGPAHDASRLLALPA